MGWSAAASAITNLAGSYMQSEAAKQAAATQASAANRATDLQRQMFQTINDQAAPYRASGNIALGMINQGLGAPPTQGPTPAPSPIANASAGVDPNSGQPLTFGTGDVAGNVKYDPGSGQYVKFLEDSNSWQPIGPGYQPPAASVPQAPGAAAPGALAAAGGGIPSGYFTTPFTAPDMYLSPSYQFQLNQGLGQTANFMNAHGGLQSGNTLRGLTDYAIGAAGQGYGQAADIYFANQSNIYNRLASVAGLGQQANTTVAGAGSSLGAGMANSTMNAGAAAAGGTVGSANAIAGGLNNAASWYTLNSMLNRPPPNTTASQQADTGLENP
jgi:hypothetical protein